MTSPPPPGSHLFSQSSVAVRRAQRADSAGACITCGASDANGAQAAALAALATLASSCNSANVVVSQNPLGKYGWNGSCTYDCGFMEQDWSWWADYRPINASLAQSVDSSNITDAYQTAFAPTQQWLTNALPARSSSITADLTSIGQIDQAIIQSGGEITPQEQAALDAAFNDIAAQLQDNLGAANLALQNLASYLSWVQGHTGDLQSNVDGSKAYIKSNATAIENDLLGKIACGAGDVQASFNVMFNDVDAKFAAMQPGFSTVTTNLQAAINAGSKVAGVFLVLQSDSKLVSDQASQARQTPPTSPLRKMRLNMAGENWTSFVQEADSQFLA